jgi:uncharacterized protein YfbU (UPF0304 family)
MTNTKAIVNAFKESLPMQKAIDELHTKISDLHRKMLSVDIQEIKRIYKLVFRNIHPDKKPVCDIDWKDKHYPASEYNKRRIFLNRDGFSLSDIFISNSNFNLNDKRSNYIEVFAETDFLKVLKLLYEKKAEIISACSKEQKKLIATRFFDAFEKSGCKDIFDKLLNFNELTESFKNELTIEYYDRKEITQLKIPIFVYSDAAQNVYINPKKVWGEQNQIEFNDLEKCSQIFDELMSFLNRYFEMLKAKDVCLLSFIQELKDAFAKELILNSLK